MNTLPWMAAAGAIMWLALYCFNTLNQDGLGIVLAVLLFPLCLVFVVLAAYDDFKIMFGGRERDG